MTSSPRRLKGRKFYWHGDPSSQAVPRFKARTHQSAAMRSTAEVFDPGSNFVATVRFENLDPAELGSLLAALDPARVLTDVAPPGFGEAPRIAGRVGGGKPLGFGTIVVDHLELSVHSAASRYGSEPAPEVDISSFVSSFTASAPASVKATWPDLAAVLDTGHVNPKVIWYPPGRDWTHAGEEAFDRGYQFWKKSAGNPDHDQLDMVTLPPPRSADQYLDIIEGG